MNHPRTANPGILQSLSLPLHRGGRSEALARRLYRLGPTANILFFVLLWGLGMFMGTNTILASEGFHPHGSARMLWLISTLALWCGSGFAIGLAHWLRVDGHVSSRR